MKTKLLLIVLMCLPLCGSGQLLLKKKSIGALPVRASGGGSDYTTGWIAGTPLTGGSGTTATDASGNGNDFTLNNSDQWIGSGIWTNNGVDRAMHLTSDLAFGSPTVTIMVWIWIDSGFSGTGVIAESTVSFDDNANCFYFYVSGSDLYTGQKDSIPKWQILKYNEITKGAWHHIAVAFDHSNTGVKGVTTLWYDGVQQTPTATILNDDISSASNFATAPLHIASRAGSAYFTPCAMHAFRVYNHALNDSQVDQVKTFTHP